ncbi:MAG: hypothetical protein PHS80_00340 [Methanothrix sp.]|nr:hypothetical protein [Bacteroidales bacterium]MDD2753949.1 hypothetical protein [Methanothrix sp.]
MVKARFSNKMLNDLAESYRSRIKRERDSEECHFKSEKSLLRDVKQAEMIESMRSAIIASGAEYVSVTSCSSYTSEIRLSIIIKHENLSEKMSDVVDIDNKRRESCKKHKQMLQDLDDWVIKCIESQEITPFTNVPDIEHSSIECF